MKENEAHVMVTIAVPFDPGKRPEAPATKLPGRGNDTIGKYVLNESFLSCFWYSWQFVQNGNAKRFFFYRMRTHLYTKFFHVEPMTRPCRLLEILPLGDTYKTGYQGIQYVWNCITLTEGNGLGIDRIGIQAEPWGICRKNY